MNCDGIRKTSWIVFCYWKHIHLAKCLLTDTCWCSHFPYICVGKAATPKNASNWLLLLTLCVSGLTCWENWSVKTPKLIMTFIMRLAAMLCMSQKPLKRVEQIFKKLFLWNNPKFPIMHSLTVHHAAESSSQKLVICAMTHLMVIIWTTNSMHRLPFSAALICSLRLLCI